MLLALLVLPLLSAPLSATQGPELLIRPHPQIIQPSTGDFVVTSETAIVIPKGWPACLRVSARELAAAIQDVCGVVPKVVETEKPDFRKGNITIAPYDWFPSLPWIEPTPQAIIRSAPAEGYNIRITPEYVYLAGNSPRGCFMGLQTLIQIARQGRKTAQGGLALPGVFISDWPSHNWRTLQLPLGVYGSPYDRGEHRYRHITRVDLLERAIRLAAHNKMTGLVVEVGTGMTYDRAPEIFVEGFSTNEKAKVSAAADLAKSLGLELVPFLNASAGHDIWLAPYSYAVPNSDLYMEALFDTFDEAIETLRPAHLHLGMDEDVASDFDEVPLRGKETHKKIILASYEFLRRRGVSTLVWNDGISLLGTDIADVPRDIVVLPWLYGGNDFTPAKQYVDLGFRILCSPWSQWHVENDQFFSIYASTLKSDKVLGMAGTIWYPIPPDAENDYRRCLVKAAEAFWSPLYGGNYPEDKEYFAPAYSGLPGDALSQAQPASIPQAELPGLIALVTTDQEGSPSESNFACEAARERLVAAGTAVLPALLSAMAATPAQISPWAEGTVRRIVREPVGDRAVMLQALESAAQSTGVVRALVLEMLGTSGDAAFLEKQDTSDPAICFAMGVSRDKRFLPSLLKVASGTGPGQADALVAIGRLKGTQELLSLEGSWKGFDNKCKEAYARALAMQASEAAIPVLGELAEDANWRVRFRAAIGLGATRSTKAAPYILKLLGDESPAVFKVGLYWCTDTLLVQPEEYFPRLISRLALDEEPEIVKPILHALLLMWDPGRGQWLSKNEDPALRVDYPNLSVWKDEGLAGALRRMFAYKNARLVMDAMVVLMKMGAEIRPETVLSVLDGFSIEDKRRFCVRMREERMPEAAPVLNALWETNDHLVQTFILQYCQRVYTPEAFEIAYQAFFKIPESDTQFRAAAVWAMASHVNKLDVTAKRAILLILDYYDKVDLEGRLYLDAALCRASGREPLETWSTDPADIAKRLSEWREWWEAQPR